MYNNIGKLVIEVSIEFIGEHEESIVIGSIKLK